MRKSNHKEKILSEGLRVVHKQGYSAASVRDIVQAAGVPQGSFTNHFASKEAFGLAILNRYYDDLRSLMEDTLLNDSLPPLRRFKQWTEANINLFNQEGNWNGCLLGNFSSEINVEIGSIQERLCQILEEQRCNIAYCLRAGVKAGDLPSRTKCDELAGFIHSALQGAILMSKAMQSHAPMEQFKKVLFSRLLKA